ncbi:hypothetical protein T484DRAFT_1874300 [Baffinella frigidus]|nr:hypothetical protein T484DRAFT_1874300 [Cryptophyta sp. CCMP2293]
MLIRLGRASRGAEGVEQTRKGVQWLGKAALQGVVEAQLELGQWYLSSAGGRNSARGVACLRQAVEDPEGGDAGMQAMVHLADCLIKGEGVPVDATAGVKLLDVAASGGCLAAYAPLGLARHEGVALQSADSEAAVATFDEGARLGDTACQYLLGVAHLNGEGGLQKSKAKALPLLRIAAEKGLADGMHCLAITLFEDDRGGRVGNGGVKARSKEEEDEKDRVEIVQREAAALEAVKWLRRAAVKGHNAAGNALALCYLKGRGCKRDAAAAQRWWTKAAANSDADSAYNLAVALAKGVLPGGAKEKEARRWCEKAVEMDGSHLDAKFMLAVWLLDGFAQGLAAAQGAAKGEGETKPDQTAPKEGGAKEPEGGGGEDPARGVKLLREASKGGHVGAARRLAMKGEGCEADEETAFATFLSAAQKGDSWAMFKVGQCYEEGRGVRPSRTTAVKWYNKGATQAQLETGVLLRDPSVTWETIDELAQQPRGGGVSGQGSVMNALDTLRKTGGKQAGLVKGLGDGGTDFDWSEEEEDDGGEEGRTMARDKMEAWKQMAEKEQVAMFYKLEARLQG